MLNDQLAKFLLLLVWQAAALANPTEFTLNNGLKVIVKEDHRAPIVAVQVCYKVGGSYEPSGLTGISHALEHVMFKGAPSHSPGHFSWLITAEGGEDNAYTNRDYTSYQHEVLKQNLPLSLKLEADRMHKLRFSEAEFAKEKQVVMEERRSRVDDQPKWLAYERFNAAAFTSSPYRQPVIGWMHEIEQLTLNDIKAWYKNWYAPNNATLVIVGDVELTEIKKLVNRYFASIPVRSLPVLKKREEITSLGLKHITVQLPIQQPFIFMGYNVPVANTAPEKWQPYALDILTHVLGGGESSRLAKLLTRGDKALATSIYASYEVTSRLSGLLSIHVAPRSAVEHSLVIPTVQAEIKSLQVNGIMPEELIRTKNKITADYIYSQDSVAHQARLIGHLESVGLSWQLMEQFVEQIQQVTAEQVQQVAQKYLRDERLTIAELTLQ